MYPRRWRHPNSRDLWVAAHPCCPRSHRNWAFFKTPTRCETSHATSQITSCLGLGLRPQFPPPKRSSFSLLLSNAQASRGLQGPQLGACRQRFSGPSGVSVTKHQLFEGPREALWGVFRWPLASRPPPCECAAARGQAPS